MTLSVFDAARDEPARLAVVADGLELTFAALATRVEQRLGELHAAGALDPHGQRPVAVVARPTLAVVETLLALFSAGTPALLVHARASEPEREALRVRAGAITEPSGASGGTAREATPRIAANAFDPERIAVLIPTSGSTGEPRLARLSHRALIAANRAMVAHAGIEDDRWLLALPLAHIGGLSILVRCLLQRRTLVLFEPERGLLAELERLTAVVQERAITVISLVPTLLARLLEPPLAWRPPPSLRLLLLGGAPIPRELVRRARERGLPVVPTYGMTESCAAAVMGRYAERLALPPDEGEGELMPSGVPVEGVELRLDAGVVELRGDTLFSGYLGAPDLERGSWLTTQDRGVVNEHGELTVTGRTTDVIITGGEKVDPAEVEAALMALPGVKLACVLGLPDPTFGEVVTALLVVTAEGPTSASAVAERLASRLARFKLPRRVELVAALPLTPAGKLDRQTARLPYARKS